MTDLRGQLPTRPGARGYYLRWPPLVEDNWTWTDLQRALDAITGITLHYTAGSPYATVEDIAAYQVGPTAQEDFPAIAYPFVIDRKGHIYQCHDLWLRTWHNGAVVDGLARNRSHVGVCWIGNYSPTLLQRISMGRVIGHIQRTLGRTLSVEGHGDSYQTSCPGPEWPDWRPQVLAAIT